MLRRGWGVLILLAVSLTMALSTGQELVFSLAYLLAALFLISLVFTWANLRWLSLERKTRSKRSQVGKLAVEDFTVTNKSFLPKLWLELRDGSTLPEHRAGRVMGSIGGHQKRLWNVRTYCLRRGRFRLGPITLYSGDPFGLFYMKRSIPESSSIVIYPATVDIPRFKLPYGDLPGGEAMRRRTHHITDNVSGVREYAYGDSFNRIHWPSSARTGRLIVKEFELDPTTDVWMYVDMDEGVHVAAPWAEDAAQAKLSSLWMERTKLQLPPATEEYAATITASLIRHFLIQGRSVGLVAYGQTREVVQADRDTRQLNKLLETLAVLKAQGRLPFGQILAAEGESLPRGTTIVAITPAADLDWIGAARDLERRGIRVVAVLIQADTFAPAPDQTAALAELRASAIPTFVVRRGDEIGVALSTVTAGSLLTPEATIPAGRSRRAST